MCDSRLMDAIYGAHGTQPFKRPGLPQGLYGHTPRRAAGLPVALCHIEGLNCLLTLCQTARQHNQAAFYSAPAVSESTKGTKAAPFRCRHRTAWHWVRPLDAPAPSRRAAGPPAQSRHAVVAGVPRRCAPAAWQLTRPPAMLCPCSESCHWLSVSRPGSAAGLVS